MGTQHLRRAAALGLLVCAFGAFGASTARALGPTATEWKDFPTDGDAKAKTPVGVTAHLNAVHGKQRPNVTGTLPNQVWAVGDAGTILYFNGTSWTDLTSKNPATGVNLHDVYIFPVNLTVGVDSVVGFAVGDGGTVLRIKESFAGSGVFSFACDNCPAGGCGAGGGGPLNICATLFDIFEVDPTTNATSLFVIGEAMRTPPDSAPPGGSGPALLFWNGSTRTWQRLTGATTPFNIDYSSWPAAYGPPWATSRAGLITAATTATAFTAGGIMDSFGRHVHLSFTSPQWSPMFGTSDSLCPSIPYTSSTYEPLFNKAVKIGAWSIIAGDIDSCGTLPSTLPPTTGGVATNLYAWNQTSAEPVTAIQTGLPAARAPLWGSLNDLDALPSWGYGVAIGQSSAAGADFNDWQTGAAPEAYFARLEWPNLLKLPAPEDPSSPNGVFYEKRPGGKTWGPLHGLFISAYNEAFAVGDNGLILHWTGPPVPPANLEVSLTQSPAGSLIPGSWVELVLTVTNTGGAGVSGLAANISITPPTALTQVCPLPPCPTCTATYFSCPTSLPGGGSVSFTWTYSVSGCGSNVTIAGTASGANLLPPPAFVISSTSYTIGSAFLALSATVSHTPVAPNPGDVVTYTINVMNVGSATVDNLWVADTVPAGMWVDPAAPPGAPVGFTLTRTASPTSTMFIWSGVGLTPPIPPGGQVTFTFAATVLPACQVLTITDTAWVAGTNACGSAVAFTSSPDGFALSAPLDAGLTITSKEEIPGRYKLTVVLTVTNTGAPSPPAQPAWVNNIRPAQALTLTPNSGDTIQISGPISATWWALAPLPSCGGPSTCVLLPNCSASYTWEYRSSALSPVMFTAQVAADVCPAIASTDCQVGCTLMGGSTCIATAAATTWFTDSGEVGEFTLDRNLFRGRTEKVTAAWQLKESGQVEVTVYNSIGQRIKTLYKGYAIRRLPYSAAWDGTNDAGERVASGAYFIKIDSDRLPKTKKVALLK